MSIDQIVSYIGSGLQILSSLIPVAGPVIARVLGVALGAAGVATALVAILHAVVGVLRALSAMGLSSASKVADKLSVIESEASGLDATLLSILQQLSILPLPGAPAPAPSQPPAA